MSATALHSYGGGRDKTKNKENERKSKEANDDKEWKKKEETRKAAIRSVLRRDRYGTIHFSWRQRHEKDRETRKEGNAEALGRLHTRGISGTVSSSDAREPGEHTSFMSVLKPASNKPRYRFDVQGVSKRLELNS